MTREPAGESGLEPGGRQPDLVAHALERLDADVVGVWIGVAHVAVEVEERAVDLVRIFAGDGRPGAVGEALERLLGDAEELAALVVHHLVEPRLVDDVGEARESRDRDLGEIAMLHGEPGAGECVSL